LVTLGTSLLLFAGSARANLLVNGSFELPVLSVPNTTYPSGSGALTGWSISGTSGIDHVGTLWQAADGSQSISLNWTSPSTIAQTVTTVNGQSYRISFSLAADNPAENATVRTVDVFWGVQLLGSLSFDPAGKTSSSMGWVGYSFDVQGTGSDILKFVSTTPSAWGPALDNVEVLPAGPTGACCRPNNVCTLDTTYDECVKLGGRWGGAGSTTCLHDAAGDCIPTLSEWGVAVMGILVLTAGTIVVMRRRAAA
jgi:choice-of-anchor C domain-containing protein